MARRGGSFGLVVLVVVLAIVLALVARSWRRVAPQAIEVGSRGTSARVVDDHGATQAGDALRSGQLPNLEDTQRTTDAHAAEVRDALAGSD